MIRSCPVLILILLVLLMPALAFAETATLQPGTSFFKANDMAAGNAFSIEVKDVEWKAARGVRHYAFHVGGHFQHSVFSPRDAVRVGRSISIRGNAYYPVTVTPDVDGKVIRSVKIETNRRVLNSLRDEVSFPKGLAIITTNDILSSSANLEYFAQHKRDRDWEVVVATQEDWDHSTGASADSRADRIRFWLAENYEELGIGYVLLIGNPDPVIGDVPMKMAYAIQNICDATDDEIYCEMAQAPTDAYYMDLEGDWDLNGDGRFAEYPADMGAGGVDIGPEVVVGRIPVYQWDIVGLDNVLQTAMDLDDNPDVPERKRILLPGAILGIEGYGGSELWDGAEVIDVIGQNLVSRGDQEQIIRLYEREGLATSTVNSDIDLSVDNVVGQWREGAGFVVWYGHGGTQSAHRYVWLGDYNHDNWVDYDEMDYPVIMSSWDAERLVGSTPAFVFQISCENGHPEDTDNLGKSILHYGAAGTVAASRSAMGEMAYGGHWEPSDHCAAAATQAYYFTQKLVDGWRSGDAMAYIRYGFGFEYWPECAPGEWYGGADTTSLGWLAALEMNLYGDPTLMYDYSYESDDDVDDDADDDWVDDDSDDDADDDDRDPDDDDEPADDDIEQSNGDDVDKTGGKCGF